MKHVLTLSFALDDAGTNNVLGYALDQVLAAIESLPLDKDNGEGFVCAELDGELMVDKGGNAPEDVKCLKRYETLLKNLVEG